MRRTIPILAVLSTLAIPTAAAQAAATHVVAPGETLWSIASANHLAADSLASYNGLSTEGTLLAGSTVTVPTTAEAPASTTHTSSSAGPAPLGGYTVRAGDTLSGLASGAGVSVEAMAAMNGLDPAAPLPSGTVIKLPAGAAEPAAAAEPAPAPVVSEASPHATAQSVDAGTVAQIAADNGVPGSLAAAIGYQESGFNNNMVSSANARGVMQVMPGTWDWVQQNLSAESLDPNSATDNVRAGTLYLKHLLEQTGGDQAAATAAYYQGLGSTRSIGNYDDTNQYVANVQALQSRFGG